MSEGLLRAIENNKANGPASARDTLEVFTPCDGCGPNVRAAHVWVLNPCPCHGQRWVLTFCGHCSHLQAPALHRQQWAQLENETATK